MDSSTLHTVTIVVGILLIAAAYHYVGQSVAHKSHMSAIAHHQQYMPNMYDVSRMDSRMSDRAAIIASKKHVSADRARTDATVAMQNDAARSNALRSELARSSAIQLGKSPGGTGGGSQEVGDLDRLENSLFRRRS